MYFSPTPHVSANRDCVSLRVAKFLREPPGGPEGVRSTERSEPRKVATRSEAKGHAQTDVLKRLYKRVFYICQEQALGEYGKCFGWWDACF
jgi:hypothetical protein